jgi:membrane protein
VDAQPAVARTRRASSRYVEQRGNHMAGAVAFFTVLTAVPLLMMAFAAAGFVLWLRPSLLVDVEEAVRSSVPAQLRGVVEMLVRVAVDQRNAVGVIGLVSAVWAGLTWMSHLREAVSSLWRLPVLPPLSVGRVLRDLWALVVVGLGLLASRQVTAAATGFARTVLTALGVVDDPPARALLGLLGAVLSLAADWLIFCGALARLPRVPVPVRTVRWPALVGAVGFELLKQATALGLGSVSRGPTGAVFGTVLGSLVFLYLVSRFVLLVVAYTATAGD